MPLFTPILFLLLSVVAYAQQPQAPANDLVGIHHPPAEFPGGTASLHAFIKKNFQWQQPQQTIVGKVFVEFIVNTDGTVSNATILKSLCASCDAEALRIVGLMPAWKPATINNQPVRSKMVLPFSFHL